MLSRLKHDYSAGVVVLFCACCWPYLLGGEDMTTNSATTMIHEKLTQDELSDLRAIRRSSMAIQSCAEILNEHNANEGSIPCGPRIWIHLEPNQVGGLCYAMEACANRITSIFDSAEFEDIGFQDDICADLTKEAQLAAELQAGTISFDEYQRKAGGAS
jgi:hypothetical protein